MLGSYAPLSPSTEVNPLSGRMLEVDLSCAPGLFPGLAGSSYVFTSPKAPHPVT